LLAATGAAEANTRVQLGTATGGLMIYYNNLDVSGAAGVPDGVVSGYDENGANQAYSRAQNGYANTNGMGFQFDPTDLGGFSFNDVFSGQPVGQSQFGLDLLGLAPTYDGSGGVTLPDVDFADTDYPPAGATFTDAFPENPLVWAINDYKGSSPNGPQNTATSPVNSLLRGTSVTFTKADLTPPAGAGDTTFELDVAGELVSDGLIHWYYGATGTTDLTSWMLGDTLYFEGTLVYDMNYAAKPWGTPNNTYGSGLENGSDQRDFYEGSLDVYADVIPEPVTMAGLVLGVGSLVGYVRRRRKA
jgi:hypothetical protein